MNHKAQMQMTETIAVLFIFFVLILFGIVFYYQYQRVSISEKNQELIAVRAVDTTLKTLFLPELSCSRGEAETEDNCIDMMKLRQANATFQRHLEEYYFQIFSYSSVAVYQVYPTPMNFTLYDKPKPDYTNFEPTFFVVSLRDETAGEEPTYNFGYIKVGVYS